MNETKEQTCEARIQGQLDRRADDVRRMLAVQATAGEHRICLNCGQDIYEGSVDYSDTPGWVHTLDDEAKCDVDAEDSPDAEPDNDYTEDSLANFGLSLERRVTFKFLMSTGGPADWLEITCDPGDPNASYGQVGGAGPYIERVTYHFADWFDHAEQVVTDGPLFELAEWIVEGQS